MIQASSRLFAFILFLLSGPVFSIDAASSSTSNATIALPSSAPKESATPLSSAAQASISEKQFHLFDDIVNAEIRANRIPGAVVVIGQADKIIYRRAFGLRSFTPKQSMTPETIFDLASVSKVFVTTTAIMQLVEQGRINLDSPASNYWPDFSGQNKETITVKQLLTHTSGLPAGIIPGKGFTARQVLEQICRVKPVGAAGQQVLYSDLNFVALGKIIALVSGSSLDGYAAQHIFSPLKLSSTGFNPKRNSIFTRSKRALIAPTIAPPNEVQDPLARTLDGVAGSAGVFTSADDLAAFAQALLNGGAPILSKASVTQMFLPQLQTPYSRRGLGWRTDAVLASNHAALPFAGSVSHFGYTGTGLWIDPVRNVFVVILSNRLILKDGGDLSSLRAKFLNAVAQQLGPIRAQDIIGAKPELASWLSPYMIHSIEKPVLTGIDVLAEQKFAPLKNKRVALLTNRGAVNQAGLRTIDVLFNAPDVKLVKLFSPEHGLNADQEGKIKDNQDPQTQLRITSLYGDKRKPTREMLAGLDAVVVDLQDVGVRFYTYASSVAYLLEVAAPLKIPVFILDRPNPVDAISVQGPVLDQKFRSFTGYWPIPVRHGLTMAELAELFKGEAKIPAILRVIPMKNYVRTMHYDDTGFPFVTPSPNLSTLTSLTLYPGVGMIEAGAVSVGRGTAIPFEIIGAPWIDGQQLSIELNKLQLPGLEFRPTQFTPEAAPYAGKVCQGVRINIIDKVQINTPHLGLAMAISLWKLYPEKFALKSTLGSVGSQAVLEKITLSNSLGEVIAAAEPELIKYKKVREKYLLYP